MKPGARVQRSRTWPAELPLLLLPLLLLLLLLLLPRCSRSFFCRIVMAAWA